MEKQSLKGKKVLLLPNTKTTDLMDNENLLTNTIIKMTNMLQAFEVESVTLNPENQYDVIVARHIDTYKTQVLDHVKISALIFNYDSINAGWWFSESIDSEGVVFNNEQREENSSFINCIENPYWDIDTKHPIK